MNPVLLKNAVAMLLSRNPDVRALKLWESFEVSRPTVYELVKAVQQAVDEGLLPSGFDLKGLRKCAYCPDRYFLRGQDKRDHQIEHAKYFPGTLPRFEARYRKKQQRFARRYGF